MTEPTNPLNSSIGTLKGIGPKMSELFAKKGIGTLEDALYFLPRTYEDRRNFQPIGQLRATAPVTTFGKVLRSRAIRRGRRSSFEVVLGDPTGELTLFWFNAYPQLKAEFEKDKFFVVYGDVKFFGAMPKITHPEYEAVTEFRDGKPVVSANFGRVVPVYSETEGLHQKVIRKTVALALRQSLNALDEPFPSELLKRLNLPALRDSFVAAHYPKEIPPEGKPNPNVNRIVFEEFFTLQLGLGLKKQKSQTVQAPPLAEAGRLPEFLRALPFELTDDQKKVLADIRRDIARPVPMCRLIQGDVGSGKTVVALAAATVAAGSGCQAVLLAPTEVLAQQHFKTAEKYLTPLGVKSALVAHGAGQNRELAAQLASGEVQIAIGTHALLQEKISFRQLGLVVVDEQHRFGVDQRAELTRRGQGRTPHLLMMTATPIPRTLAFTLYGDLDLSIIRQKPAGRKPVKTTVLRDRERPRLYSKIRDAVNRGEQVYIIYPLVEQSEKLELKSATQMFDSLSREVFPQFSIALLHGRMKGDEKETILRDFKAGKYSILISTTVIEVGIDVPNATLMVIEHPERLGLSQLHQLRGRVGRGELTSECILVADSYVTPRLRVMERSDDGFVIAEEDLKIRGPGEFLGTRQSGMPGFRVGHILRDADLLSSAREEALKILATDPDLSAPENTGIRRMVESRWKEKIERLKSG